MAWTPQTTTLADYACLLEEQDNLAFASGETDELVVTRLAYDSRAVEPGTLFICKGAHFEPDYLVQAARAGAVAYVSEADYTTVLEDADIQPLPLLLVQDIRPAIADVAAYFYRGLLSQLTLIGFTGTKGKSTTTTLLTAILDSWMVEQGKPRSAWLSSIDNYDGKARTRSLLTTQETLELYTHFEHAVESGIGYLTMEVSSQALKYCRTRNLTFEVAGFLNIGEDHISAVEHPTHEDYLVSKLEIFKQCNTALVNLSINERERVLDAATAADEILTFGLEEGDFAALDIQSSAQGLSFTVKGPGWTEPFVLPLAGRFNVENALAAIAAASALGVPVGHMQNGLAHCEVSGRMQLVQGPDDKLIIIDYAHNKLSFETLFAAVSEDYPLRPLISVFGATGTKGVERRIDLPTVAAQYSHKIYITEDDPGKEPLALINEQIAHVVEAAGVAYEIVEDRDEAITRAITEAPKDSLILVLGKGHETTMRRGRDAVEVPTDRERVAKILESL